MAPQQASTIGGKARANRYTRTALALLLAFGASVSAPGPAHAGWDFRSFINLITGNGRNGPSHDQLLQGYQLFAASVFVNTALTIPKTLHSALTLGRGVSVEQRRQICAETKGDFASSIVVSACLDGQASVSATFGGAAVVETQSCDRGTGNTYSNACVYRDQWGKMFWDDGPSIPAVPNGALPGFENYILLFWPAGQWHDYCYHHGAKTYGWNKTSCDDRFSSLMYSLCTDDLKKSTSNGGFDWYQTSSCVQAAALATAAVRTAGDAAYESVSTFVEYESPWRGLPPPMCPPEGCPPPQCPPEGCPPPAEPGPVCDATTTTGACAF